MSEPNVLMQGIALGESPRWHQGRLWFADWAAQQIIAIDSDGHHEVMVPDTGRAPICFDWLPDGSLLVVSGRDSQLLRHTGVSLVPHTDLSPLATQPWNEIVVDGRGNAYINNTGFDFPAAEYAPGSIALLTPDGDLRWVAHDLAFPNGMAVTPDDGTLLVAESYTGQITAFDIAPDGSIANRRIWAHVNGSAPDGISLDADGAIWYADVPNRCCVRVREGGEVLQKISLDRGGFACMLGGTDGHSLFILAADWRGPASLAEGERTGHLLVMQVSTPHAGWP